MTESLGRRDYIVASAAELFARKGIGATTVREIADAVGILSGSLYHHFESKDAIVQEILTEYLDTIRRRYADVVRTDSDPIENLRALILASLQVAEEHPHPTAIYQNDLNYLREQPLFETIQASAADIHDTWLNVIEKGVADGSLRNDIEARVFYRLIRDSVWLSVRWRGPVRWRRPDPDGDYSTQQLAHDITSVFLHGFATGAAASGTAGYRENVGAHGAARAATHS